MPRFERLHLPSGVLAVFDAFAPETLQGLFVREAEAFRGRCVDAEGTTVPLRNLTLADFHTLRALLYRLGAIPEPALTVSC